jgi:hypothetical protein
MLSTWFEAVQIVIWLFWLAGVKVLKSLQGCNMRVKAISNLMCRPANSFRLLMHENRLLQGANIFVHAYVHAGLVAAIPIEHQCKFVMCMNASLWQSWRIQRVNKAQGSHFRVAHHAAARRIALGIHILDQLS